MEFQFRLARNDRVVHGYIVGQVTIFWYSMVCSKLSLNQFCLRGFANARESLSFVNSVVFPLRVVVPIGKDDKEIGEEEIIIKNVDDRNLFQSFPHLQCNHHTIIIVPIPVQRSYPRVQCKFEIGDD